MTVENNPRRVAYTATGSTTGPFAITFGFFEIAVYLNNALVSPTDYVITQSSPGSTGSVTFDVAPTGEVVIVGATDVEQQIDYISVDDVEPETVEQGLDRLTMIVQEQNLQFSRSLRIPSYQDEVPELDFGNNPNTVLYINADGQLSHADPDTVFDGDIAAAAASASAAASSATTASGHATNAANSANAAAASATEASGYATNASNSAAAAAASAAEAAEFVAGTRILFFQATAPLGWSKVTDYDDHAIRIVSGPAGATGGTTAFSSVLTSRTIAQANLPNVTLSVSGSTNTTGSHQHGYNDKSVGLGGVAPDAGGGTFNDQFVDTARTTGAAGDHGHSVSGTTSALGSGTAMDFAVKYIDANIYEKD